MLWRDGKWTSSPPSFAKERDHDTDSISFNGYDAAVGDMIGATAAASFWIVGGARTPTIAMS